MRFCLLHHTGWPGHPDHYDLMLQYLDGINDDDLVLKTLSSVANNLPLGVGDWTQLRVQPDHRRLYLNYEGPLSGSRGQVSKIDHGRLFWLPEFAENNVRESRIWLCGRTLNGVYAIRKHTQNILSFRKLGTILN